MRTKPASPNSLPGPDEEAAPRERLRERHVVDADVDEEEVRLGRNRPRAGLARAISARRSRPTAFASLRSSTSSSRRRLARPAARAARLTLKGSRTTSSMPTSGSSTIAYPSRRPAIPKIFENVRMRITGRPALDVPQAVEAQRGIDVLDVGLVHDDAAALGERPPGAPPTPRA